MLKIKNNALFVWREFSPALRWFVIAAYCIGYLVIAVTFDPVTAFLGVIVGTVGILGILATAFAFLWIWIGIPVCLLGLAFSMFNSRQWWISVLLSAAAYGWFKLRLPSLINTDGDAALYGATALGWCIILAALYFYNPPKLRA